MHLYFAVNADAIHVFFFFDTLLIPRGNSLYITPTSLSAGESKQAMKGSHLLQ